MRFLFVTKVHKNILPHRMQQVNAIGKSQLVAASTNVNHLPQSRRSLQKCLPFFAHQWQPIPVATNKLIAFPDEDQHIAIHLYLHANPSVLVQASTWSSRTSGRPSMVTPFLLVSVTSSASDTQHPGRCFSLPERLGAMARF